MIKNVLRTSIASMALSATGAFAQTNAPIEWGNFRGPNHDGTIPALKKVSNWKQARFSKRWTKDTPNGFSSFAVAGAKAYTIVSGEEDGNAVELLVCMDVKNGKELWKAPLTVITKYDGGGDAGDGSNKGGDGPRSTPVVHGGKVYAIDANLGVYCFNATTGKSVWKRDVMKDNSGVQIKWQNAASPLIEGDVLLMCGGGSGQALLGLNKDSGEVIWKSEDDKMTHATPIIATLHDVKQCIFFTQKGLVSVNPADGKVLWRQDYKFAVSTAASPVVWQDIVYCSAGYGVGAGAFKITKNGGTFASEPIWRKEGDDLANHWSTPVVKDGYLYGMFSFKKYGTGPLACVDIRTGEVKWSEAGFGPGQVILTGDTVIAVSDKGEIVAAQATPEKYTELKRDDVLDGKVWGYPVIAYDHLFVRSTKEGVCLEIK
jgi:outer membrane protein assembly factor BamB